MKFLAVCAIATAIAVNARQEHDSRAPGYDHRPYPHPRQGMPLRGYDHGPWYDYPFPLPANHPARSLFADHEPVRVQIAELRSPGRHRYAYRRQRLPNHDVTVQLSPLLEGAFGYVKNSQLVRTLMGGVSNGLRSAYHQSRRLFFESQANATSAAAAADAEFGNSNATTTPLDRNADEQALSDVIGRAAEEVARAINATTRFHGGDNRPVLVRAAQTQSDEDWTDEPLDKPSNGNSNGKPAANEPAVMRTVDAEREVADGDDADDADNNNNNNHDDKENNDHNDNKHISDNVDNNSSSKNKDSNNDFNDNISDNGNNNASNNNNAKNNNNNDNGGSSSNKNNNNNDSDNVNNDDKDHNDNTDVDAGKLEVHTQERTPSSRDEPASPQIKAQTKGHLAKFKHMAAPSDGGLNSFDDDDDYGDHHDDGADADDDDYYADDYADDYDDGADYDGEGDADASNARRQLASANAEIGLPPREVDNQSSTTTTARADKIQLATAAAGSDVGGDDGAASFALVGGHKPQSQPLREAMNMLPISKQPLDSANAAAVVGVDNAAAAVAANKVVPHREKMLKKNADNDVADDDESFENAAKQAAKQVTKTKTQAAAANVKPITPPASAYSALEYDIAGMQPEDDRPLVFARHEMNDNFL